MKKAFDEASRLPEEEQDALAKELLEELKGERRWDSLLRTSQDQLGTLSDEALRDYKAGNTQLLDPDSL